MNELRASGVVGWSTRWKWLGMETEAEEFDRIAGFRVSEQIEEGAIVPVFVKDSRAPVAAVEDVVDVAAALSTRNTRHYL